MVLVSCKNLTNTEINCKRLFYPTQHLGILPFKKDRRDVEFYVSYRHERPLLFRCKKRGGKDEYAKPTISTGWSKMVRDKGLSVGDILMFYVEKDDPACYWIEVYTKKSGVWSLIP